MTGVRMHTKGIELKLERREIPGPVETFTKLDLILTGSYGERDYIDIYFSDLATEDLEQMRDALTAYLAENKVAANG